MIHISTIGLPDDGLDDFIAGVVRDSPGPWTIHAPGHWLTVPGLEWGAASWRLPSGCQLDFHDGVLEVDVKHVPDSWLAQNVPLHMIPTQIAWAGVLRGADAWAAVPRDQAVRNVQLIANHSELAERAASLGVALRIVGGALQGHNAKWDNIHLTDFGAWGYETLVLVITGALNGYDRYALSTVDRAHMFDEAPADQSSITNITADGFVTAKSNAQVSHAMIVGALCNDKLRDDGVWGEVGNYSQLYRRAPVIDNFEGIVRDDPMAKVNQCQGATIYQCHYGEIRNCKTNGYRAGAYHDYYTTFDLDIHHNDFEALRPVAALLSPTAKDAEAAADQFAMYGLQVRSNQLRCLPTDETGHGGVLLQRDRIGGTRAIIDVNVNDNDFSIVGKAGYANVAINADGVTGLNVTDNNRGLAAFKNPYAIHNCPGARIPTPARKGCRWPF